MGDFKESFLDNFAKMKWKNTLLIEITNTNAKIKMHNIKISIFNEMCRELYARINYKGFEFSLDEFLSEIYGIDTGTTMLLSKETIVDEYIKRLLKLIDEYIYKMRNDLDFKLIKIQLEQRRNNEIHKYQISVIEKEAITAFEEERYNDVIEIYSSVEFPNEIQRKRIEISKKRKINLRGLQ